ncbi:beta-propeller fold lactonase family protein [Heyndrickxia sp. MSNUG]|uniref:beta-propeller fold lactonase family protein n=1 Tax=Heyndrickxia sp. MSNUG TaxID=3136677 RepID=UPI003C2AB288
MNKARFILIGLMTAIVILLMGCGANDSKGVSEETDDAADQGNTVKVGHISDEKYFYTANEGGTISKINVKDNKVAATLKAEGIVHNVQISPDGKIVAATLVPKPEGGHGDHGGHEIGIPGSVLFYDVHTNKLLKKVEVGKHPAHVVFTNDGKYVLVTNNEDHTATVIEANSYKVVTTIATGKGPHGFRISADSRLAYIANMAEDTVSVINLDTMKEEKKLKVGETPVTTGITKDGNTLAVTLFTENALAIIDIETDERVKVKVGLGPAQVYIDPNDQFAFVANQGTEDVPSNSMSIVDLKSKRVVDEIETGNGSHGVVISQDSKFAYVTNMFENTVSIIDLTSKEVTTIEVGEIPNGITIME